jgi:DNA-binding CsgD family transcriptional regulator
MGAGSGMGESQYGGQRIYSRFGKSSSLDAEQTKRGSNDGIEIILEAKMPLLNCFRCGKDFEAKKKIRVCPGCRKPRMAQLPVVLGQPFTRREQHVMELIVQGKIGREIAQRLCLTEGTVKTYVSIMLRKTGLNSRTALAVWWVKTGANSNLVRSAD